MQAGKRVRKERALMTNTITNSTSLRHGVRL